MRTAVGRTDKWQQVYDRIRRRSEKLVCGMRAWDLPVPIAALASGAGVHRFVLRPMLPSGGLTIEGGEITLYLNCARGVADEWRKQLLDEVDLGRWLPPWVRFTVAHEVAHALFYRRSNDGLVDAMEVSGLRSVRRLEMMCNEIAGRMLVPERLLRLLVGDEPLLRADRIWRLAGAFRVTPHVLIKRLVPLQRLSAESGLVAVISYKKDGLCVRAVATDQRGSALFSSVKVGTPVAELIDPASIANRDRANVRVAISCVVGGENAKQECEVQFQRNYAGGSTGVISMKLLGEAQR